MTDSPTATPSASRSGKVLLVVGYLTAFVLPFLGLVLGALILIGRRTWHGAVIVLISLLSMAVFLSLASDSDDGGSLSPATQREFRALKECLAKELPRAGAKDMIRACEKQAFR